MAKKKEKTQVINNIKELNLEIDYDKLADAIVKAQTKQKEPNEKKKNFREKAMSFSNSALYFFIYIIAGLCIVQVWNDYSAETTSLFVSIFCTVLFAFCGVYAFLCHREALHDNGQEAQTHFNSNIALIALIVALVALFKEMG